MTTPLDSNLKKRTATAAGLATAFGSANAEVFTAINPANNDVTVSNFHGAMSNLTLAPEGTSFQMTIENEAIAYRYGLPVIPDDQSILVQRISLPLLGSPSATPAQYKVKVLIGNGQGVGENPDTDIGNGWIYSYPDVPQTFFDGIYTLNPGEIEMTFVGRDPYILDLKAAWATALEFHIQSLDEQGKFVTITTGQDSDRSIGNPALAWWADGMAPDTYAPLRLSDVTEEQPYVLGSVALDLQGTLISSVPEPSSGAFLGASLLAAAFAGTMKRKIGEMRTANNKMRNSAPSHDSMNLAA